MSDFKNVDMPFEGLDPNKRVKYTQGMVLGVDEFRQEQIYFMHKNKLHNYALHGYGTVYGLQVKVTDETTNPQLMVMPGMAVNQLGQEIEIKEPQCADLNKWYNNHKNDPEMSGSPLETTVYLVLKYFECKTDNVPIPGKPCRTEEDTLAPSRIKDDFELLLTYEKPPMLEEIAVKAFGDLLQSIEISSEAADYLQAGELAGLVRKIADIDREECLQPTIDKASPPMQNILYLSPDSAQDELREAFRVWVTEVRPDILKYQELKEIENDGVKSFKKIDINNVLLASIKIQSSESPLTFDSVEIDESCRPCLLHTRLLQEWLMYKSRVNRSRSGDNVFANVFAVDSSKLRIWVHHPENMDNIDGAVTLKIDDVDITDFTINQISPSPVCVNLFELHLTSSPAFFLKHKQKVTLKFDAKNIYEKASGLSLSEVISQADYDYLNRDAAQIITVYECICLPFLDDLQDVNAPNPGDGQLLKYDDSSAEWKPGDLTLGELSDVDLESSPSTQDKQVLTYDNDTSTWKAEDVPRALDDLSDVDLTSTETALEGNILRYRSNQWVPEILPASPQGVTIKDVARDLPVLPFVTITRTTSEKGKPAFKFWFHLDAATPANEGNMMEIDPKSFKESVTVFGETNTQPFFLKDLGTMNYLFQEQRNVIVADISEEIIDYAYLRFVFDITNLKLKDDQSLTLMKWISERSMKWVGHDGKETITEFYQNVKIGQVASGVFEVDEEGKELIPVGPVFGGLSIKRQPGNMGNNNRFIFTASFYGYKRNQIYVMNGTAMSKDYKYSYILSTPPFSAMNANQGLRAYIRSAVQDQTLDGFSGLMIEISRIGNAK